MTTVTGGGQPLDMRTLAFAACFDHPLKVISSGEEYWFEPASTPPAGNLLTTGRVFGFDMTQTGGIVTGGFIDGFQLRFQQSVEDQWFFDVRLSVLANAQTLVPLLKGGNPDAIWSAILGGKDRIEGDRAADFKDYLFGAGGSDKIYGFGGDDRLFGDGGRDSLFGDAGADTLKGGAGGDVLVGGDGRDVLTGNGGRDEFRFVSAASSAGVDRITDFVVGTDKIGLKASAFGDLGDRNGLDDGAFVINAAQGTSAQIIHDRTGGRLLFDADGTGAGLAIAFAAVDRGLAMTAADFSIFG
jgi:Ca2+-binding RTX toxin-like protein